LGQQDWNTMHNLSSSNSKNKWFYL